jgi:pyrroline-5-carboxylate reductase
VSAIERADLIIVAVKPQQIEDVCKHLNGHIGPDQTILSIAAGINIDRIQKLLGHYNIIRVMPNTPAQIGQGMSVWTNTNGVSQSNVAFAKKIIKSLGEELYVAEEKYLDIATALSASGPAYVFLFLESLIDAGVYLGLTREVANKLAIQTVLGSATLARDDNKHIAELRNMVTSPGGTTAEALLTLETGGFRSVVIDAVISAYKKSLALRGD